ncbi:MAG: ATP-binding protein [Steroidobacteraceae bacterium]|jgi:signal transduction histidine kinase
MNPRTTWCPWDENEEIAALITTLQVTEQRLEALTGGEIDTVADRAGRSFLLRRAQEQLRLNEAVKQAAILNALPAQIALLDIQGRIVSVNDAWQRPATADADAGVALEIGNHRLGFADSLPGTSLSDSRRVELGIQSVLNGNAKSFSIEHPCHSPSEQRWFLTIVSPLAADHPNGAVVMRINVSERRRLEQEVIWAASREQQRFALDLHDVLAQELVGLSLLAASAAKEGQAGVAVDVSDLQQIAAIAAKTCQDARAMAHGLAPVGMASGNLEKALRRLASATEEMRDIGVSVNTHGHDVNDIEIGKVEHLYRIAQEAVWNAARHAQCSRTIISVNVRRGRVCLTIRDNGRGMTPGNGASGIGLELMHYRAHLIGGDLAIDSQRNGGTRVRCICPAS